MLPFCMAYLYGWNYIQIVASRLGAAFFVRGFGRALFCFMAKMFANHRAAWYSKI